MKLGSTAIRKKPVAWVKRSATQATTCFYVMLSFFTVLFTLPAFAYASKGIVNVYAWSSEIPDAIINQFEKETGIRVNISTYENNEVMYAKMRATKNPGYDVIMPSSYYVDRMSKQNMLSTLDKTQLTNLSNLDTTFTHPAYDPNLQYSVPYVWGITGIFFNQKSYSQNQLSKWNDLWNEKYRDQLMLLDDTREIFSIALLALGYSPNDTNPKHIEEAYLKLLQIMPNVKVFSSDAVVSIIIDEDANIGTAWNGDIYKAQTENRDVQFIFPKEGFVIWVDNFTIPKNAPHKDNAYAFINFMLRADVAKNAVMQVHIATVNRAAKELLPQEIQNNPILYPSSDIMKRGIFQTDLGEDTLAIYEKYWEQLKMHG